MNKKKGLNKYKMKPLQLLQEQQNSSHLLLYLKKYVGSHLNKGGKITDLLYLKMFYNSIPLYLSSLVPRSVSNLSRYKLRISNDLQTVNARSNQYYHSFLPSTTKDWNSLSTETKQSDSFNSFKHSLNEDKPSVSSYFFLYWQ